MKADLKLEPGVDPKYDVKVEMRDGQFADPALPWPLEQITGSLQVQDGKVTVEKATARFGKATAELTLETRPLGPRPAGEAIAPDANADADPLRALEEKVERLQVTLRQLTLDDEFFAKLPPRAHRIRKAFQPDRGGRHRRLASRTRRRGSSGSWKCSPSRAGMTYEKFPYPVRRADREREAGRNAPAGASEFRVQVTGTASERPAGRT